MQDLLQFSKNNLARIHCLRTYHISRPKRPLKYLVIAGLFASFLNRLAISFTFLFNNQHKIDVPADFCCFFNRIEIRQAILDYVCHPKIHRQKIF